MGGGGEFEARTENISPLSLTHTCSPWLLGLPQVGRASENQSIVSSLKVFFYSLDPRIQAPY